MTIHRIKIKSFKASSSLTADSTRLDLVFEDGTIHTVDGLSPVRFSAAMAVLQSTQTVFYVYDPNTKQHAVSTAEDAPG